jgi:uncharacterized integral membrane protein
MKRLILTILFFLLVGLAAALAAHNTVIVEFNYYLGSTHTPLALVLLLTFAMGALLGLVLSIGMVVATYSERRRLRKQLALCQQEIRNLRDIPIKGRY